MLNSIEIKNYQAIHELSLDLAPYTVIVGPSSSGKSALTRAIKTLVSNKRGTAFITQGEKTCTITGNYGNLSVILTRSTSTEPNNYILREGEHEEKYTKLGGNVPEEVTSALGIEPNSALHFASQFDSPFLLNDSPAEAARQLASLTDANVILEAARASNSDKLAKSRLAKTRQTDLEDAQEQLEQLPAVDGLAAKLDEASQLLDRADEAKRAKLALSEMRAEIEATAARQKELLDKKKKYVPEVAGIRQQLNTLEKLREALEIADKIKTLQSSRVADVAVPEVRESISKLDTLRSLQTNLMREISVRQELQEKKQSAMLAITEAQDKHQSYLAEIGTCPTCGQGTNHLH